MEKTSWRNAAAKQKDHGRHNRENYKTAGNSQFMHTKHTLVECKIYAALSSIHKSNQN